MTVGELHDQLGEMIAKGYRSTPVHVHRLTFTHPLESDGCVILPVESASIEFVDQMDDDGGWKLDSAGSVESHVNCVLKGWKFEPV